jgi:hypothetical protein
MADRMAAEIRIGGEVSKALAKKLCAAVRDAGASLEWGGGAFSPADVKELLESNAEGHLHLYDDDRAWGEFLELEEFLRERKIPYDRQTACRYEYDAEEAIYRPGIGLEIRPTNGSGNAVVAVASLQPVVKSINTLSKYGKGKKATKASVLRRAERLQRLLRSKLPREMPPLEPFTIEDG